MVVDDPQAAVATLRVVVASEAAATAVASRQERGTRALRQARRGWQGLKIHRELVASPHSAAECYCGKRVKLSASELRVI